MALRVSLAALAAVLLAVSAPAQGISAETPLRPVTGALAITDARVVVAPGRVLDRATVVVRDGRIVAVGRDADVPFDARRIAGDSLTVYAGFLDALGYAGVPEPEDPDDYEGDRGDPPRERAGVTPDRDVRTLFNAGDVRIDQLRRAGFTAAHVAPRDGLFSGQGTVVLLREVGRGERGDALVLTDPLSLIARIDTAPGVYPGTPMGVLAVMRESVENARRRRASADREVRAAYAPALDALSPLLDGERAFVFVVDGWLDGFRALRASSEMGLAPILAGVPDVAPLADRLAAEGVSVFAPLALPDTVAADSAAQALPPPTTTPGGVSFVTNRRTRSYRDTDSELTALTGQRRAAVARADASPAVLASREIPFAFATLGVKPTDVHPNLVRMVAAGLAPDAALGALTTGPAEILGLDGSLGTVERGKLANLVVTRGDLFTDSTQIRHVIVEGVAYEIEARATPAGADPTAVVQATGTWDFVATTPDGSQSGTFTLTGDAGSLTGSLTADGETDPFTSVALDGNALTFTFSSSQFGEVTVAGVITGDQFEGLATLALGEIPLSATRRPE